MIFVTGLPRTVFSRGAIWVIMDRLTKSTHFIPINIRFSLKKLVCLSIKEIIKLHGVPSSILSYKNPHFTFRVWDSLERALRKKIRHISTYHPHIDGKYKRTIQSLGDLLKAYVLEQIGSLDQFILLIEFTYNNSFHSSIGMTPFEALYRRICRTLLCWYENENSLTLVQR